MKVGIALAGIVAEFNFDCSIFWELQHPQVNTWK